MRKYLAAVLASAAFALGVPSMATAQGQEPRAFGPGGAPGAHGVTVVEFGGFVSEADAVELFGVFVDITDPRPSTPRK
jgi:hypothetical protein